MLVCRRPSGVNSASSNRMSCLIREPSSSVVEFFRRSRTVRFAGTWRPMSSVTTLEVSMRRPSPPEAKYFSMRSGMRRRVSTQVRTLLYEERAPLPGFDSRIWQDDSVDLFGPDDEPAAPRRRSCRPDPRRKDRCRTDGSFICDASSGRKLSGGTKIAPLRGAVRCFSKKDAFSFASPWAKGSGKRPQCRSSYGGP